MLQRCFEGQWRGLELEEQRQAIQRGPGGYCSDPHRRTTIWLIWWVDIFWGLDTGALPSPRHTLMCLKADSYSVAP